MVRSEAAQVMRRLWSGDPSSFAGTHYRLERPSGYLRADPAPPIIVGGFGPRMAAIAGIDDMHMRRHMLGDEVRGPGLRMAHDKNIGMHGFQIVDGIQQGLALVGGRRSDIQVDHIR